MTKWFSIEELVSLAALAGIQWWVYSQTGGFFIDLFL